MGRALPDRMTGGRRSSSGAARRAQYAARLNGHARATLRQVGRGQGPSIDRFVIDKPGAGPVAKGRAARSPDAVSAAVRGTEAHPKGLGCLGGSRGAIERVDARWDVVRVVGEDGLALCADTGLEGGDVGTGAAIGGDPALAARSQAAVGAVVVDQLGGAVAPTKTAYVTRSAFQKASAERE